LPFSPFSLARSVLNVPNANLMACSIAAFFHFVSFSSSDLIGFGIRCYGRITSTSSHRPIALTRPMAGRLHQRPMRTGAKGKKGRYLQILDYLRRWKWKWKGDLRKSLGGGGACVRARVHALFETCPLLQPHCIIA
jgi:hypothetical protein